MATRRRGRWSASVRSPLVSIVLGALALIVELAAWSGAWLLSGDPAAALLAYLALHAPASVLWALALLPRIPPRFVYSQRFVLAFIFAICYAIPVLGFVATLTAFPILIRFRSQARRAPFESLQLPDFDPQQSLQNEVRSTGLRTLLLNPKVSVTARVRAMAALQSISGRTATPILRAVLRDPNEELRLLAYGMLNRFENRIGRAITTQSSILDAAEPGSRQALRSARNLSDLYWELAASGLAQEDLRVHAMGQSLAYCDRVLQRRPDDGLMQLRRARLLYEVGNVNGAEGGYGFARALNVPDLRVVPQEARLYFKQREFARVRALMQELHQWRAVPKLRRVIDYWEQA